MSRFREMIDTYCAVYDISRADKAKLLIHYPYFKTVHMLENSSGPSKAMAASIYRFVKNHRLNHEVKAKANDRRIPVAISFNRYDLASFREVFMAEGYKLPDAVTDIDTIVDLGGNIGMASLYYLVCYPNIEKVLIAEAKPQLISTIKTNLSPFLDKIVVENVCISDGSATHLSFGISANHRESRIGSTDGAGEGETVEIPAMTLGQLLERHNLEQADLLKMDIEGAEYDLLSDPDSL